MITRAQDRQASPLAQKIIAWYLENKRDLPWRRKPYCNDPYSIYVSEIMLQQTQVKTVIPYWERWMAELPTITALANAPLERVLKLWEGLGYYRRARAMHQAAKVLLDTNDGNFPTDYEGVLNLPGIGPYTAGAICSIAYNQAVPIVDGNIIRVISRLQRIQKPVEEPSVKIAIWKASDTLVRSAGKMNEPGSRSCSDLNQGLMELGATICLPRQPLCLLCPVKENCKAFQMGDPEKYPIIRDRITFTPRFFSAFIFQKNGMYLTRQRSAEVVNGGLWEFPNWEYTNLQELEGLLQKAGLAPDTAPVATIKHTITRYKMTLDIYLPVELTWLKELASEGYVWKTITELAHLPFSSAQLKILKLLAGNKLQSHTSKAKGDSAGELLG